MGIIIIENAVYDYVYIFMCIICERVHINNL